MPCRPAITSVRTKAKCRSAKFGTARLSHPPDPTSQESFPPSLSPVSFTTPRGACSISSHIQSNGDSILPLAPSGFAGGLANRSQPRTTSPTCNPAFSRAEPLGISSITTPGSTSGSSGEGSAAPGSAGPVASATPTTSGSFSGGDDQTTGNHGRKKEKANAERNRSQVVDMDALLSLKRERCGSLNHQAGSACLLVLQALLQFLRLPRQRRCFIAVSLADSQVA